MGLLPGVLALTLTQIFRRWKQDLTKTFPTYKEEPPGTSREALRQYNHINPYQNNRHPPTT